MKKKKDFFQELRDRNVWREVRAYLFGGAAIIPLVLLLQPIVGFSQNVSNIIFIIFFSLFPSVFLFALLYHDWGKTEKEKEKLNIALNTWGNADKDHVLANKAKEAAQEWGIIDILP